MMLHKLKIHPEPFEAVKRGVKTCEFRRDDRAFAVGDMLELQCCDPFTGTYDGRTLLLSISRVDRAGYDIPTGYCMLSLRQALEPTRYCDKCGMAERDHEQYMGEPAVVLDDGSPDRCGEWATAEELIQRLRETEERRVQCVRELEQAQYAYDGLANELRGQRDAAIAKRNELSLAVMSIAEAEYARLSGIQIAGENYAKMMSERDAAIAERDQLQAELDARLRPNVDSHDPCDGCDAACRGCPMVGDAP